MSSLLSSLMHSEPPTSHESGGGYPSHPGGGAAGDIERACNALQAALAATDDPNQRAEISKLHASCEKFLADRKNEHHTAMGLSAQQKALISHKLNQGQGY